MTRSPAGRWLSSPIPSGQSSSPPARAWRYVKSFYVKAYEDNLTGLSGMVAYNLLLSVLPLALLALFIASRVLVSDELERSVLEDLQELFPSTAQESLANALRRVRESGTGFGIAALVTSLWIGGSFWGAMDTAFCRIYHLECRTWLQQKRFALLMVVVVLLLMGATVAVPTLQSVLVEGAGDLPFGLGSARGVLVAGSLVAGLLLLFGLLCIVYWAVPNDRLPWRGVWPGALGATIAISIVDYSFPFYLSSVSNFTQFASGIVFIVIVLLWFYAIAIIILSGGVINAMRCAEPGPEGEVETAAPTPGPAAPATPPVP